MITLVGFHLQAKFTWQFEFHLTTAKVSMQNLGMFPIWRQFKFCYACVFLFGACVFLCLVLRVHFFYLSARIILLRMQAGIRSNHLCTLSDGKRASTGET